MRWQVPLVCVLVASVVADAGAGRDGCEGPWAVSGEPSRAERSPPAVSAPTSREPALTPASASWPRSSGSDAVSRRRVDSSSVAARR